MTWYALSHQDRPLRDLRFTITISSDLIIGAGIKSYGYKRLMTLSNRGQESRNRRQAVIFLPGQPHSGRCQPRRGHRRGTATRRPLRQPMTPFPAKNVDEGGASCMGSPTDEFEERGSTVHGTRRQHGSNRPRREVSRITDVHVPNESHTRPSLSG